MNLQDYFNKKEINLNFFGFVLLNVKKNIVKANIISFFLMIQNLALSTLL